MAILETLGIRSRSESIFEEHKETVTLENGDSLVFTLRGPIIQSTELVPSEGITRTTRIDYTKEIAYRMSHSELLSRSFAFFLMLGVVLIFVSPYFLPFMTWPIYSGMILGEVVLGGTTYYYGKKAERSIELLKQQKELRDNVREWRRSHVSGLRSATAPSLPTQAREISWNEYETFRSDGNSSEVYRDRDAHSAAKDKNRIHTRWEDIEVVTTDDLKEGNQ